jgi:hypothetical protein
MPDKVSLRPRLAKLGIKPGMRVALIGVDDPDFVAELATRTGDVVRRAADNCDAIFLLVSHRDHLGRMAPLLPRMRRDGSLWLVRPRGSRDISEAEAQQAGLDAGLVDVKVVRFSETHTAEKFVFRLRDR